MARWERRELAPLDESWREAIIRAQSLDRALDGHRRGLHAIRTLVRKASICVERPFVNG
jgi:hypothetical protein